MQTELSSKSRNFLPEYRRRFPEGANIYEVSAWQKQLIRRSRKQSLIHERKKKVLQLEVNRDGASSVPQVSGTDNAVRGTPFTTFIAIWTIAKRKKFNWPTLISSVLTTVFLHCLNWWCVEVIYIRFLFTFTY
jgi:hypothetical protein